MRKFFKSIYQVKKNNQSAAVGNLHMTYTWKRRKVGKFVHKKTKGMNRIKIGYIILFFYLIFTYKYHTFFKNFFYLI